MDDTCVLCSECFHATNHDGHDVLFSMSPGSGGCCDCADPEAWKVPLQCEIHTECCSSEDEKSLPSLPEDIVESIRSTVQTVLDYILDVFTLAPEDVSLPSSTDELLKSVQQTRSYINSVGIRERPTMEDENDVNMANTVQDALMLDSINEAKEEYVCIAWNDESHAFSHVLECIASATGCDYEQAKEIVDSIHAYASIYMRLPPIYLNLELTFKPGTCCNIKVAKYRSFTENSDTFGSNSSRCNNSTGSRHLPRRCMRCAAQMAE